MVNGIVIGFVLAVAIGAGSIRSAQGNTELQTREPKWRMEI